MQRLLVYRCAYRLYGRSGGVCEVDARLPGKQTPAAEKILRCFRFTEFELPEQELKHWKATENPGRCESAMPPTSNFKVMFTARCWTRCICTTNMCCRLVTILDEDPTPTGLGVREMGKSRTKAYGRCGNAGTFLCIRSDELGALDRGVHWGQAFAAIRPREMDWVSGQNLLKVMTKGWNRSGGRLRNFMGVKIGRFGADHAAGFFYDASDPRMVSTIKAIMKSPKEGGWSATDCCTGIRRIRGSTVCRVKKEHSTCARSGW